MSKPEVTRITIPHCGAKLNDPRAIHVEIYSDDVIAISRRGEHMLINLEDWPAVRDAGTQIAGIMHLMRVRNEEDAQ